LLLPLLLLQLVLLTLSLGLPAMHVFHFRVAYDILPGSLCQPPLLLLLVADTDAAAATTAVIG